MCHMYHCLCCSPRTFSIPLPSVKGLWRGFPPGHTASGFEPQRMDSNLHNVCEFHETSFVKRFLFKRFELKNQKEPTRTCCSQGAKSASKWNRSIFTASGTGNMRLIHQFKSTLEQWIRQNSLTSPTSYHDKVPVTLFYKYLRNAQGNCTHRPTQLPRFLYFQLILPCTEQRESENRTARRISVRTASQSCHKHSWNITSKTLPFWACCLDIRITQSSAPCG